MPHPFHYSFFVRDLGATRRFYGELLGCREGRSTDTWVDFDFFGHQISAHTAGDPAPTEDRGIVDGISVPMPHFGAILDWDGFHALAARLTEAGCGFVVTPRLRFAGQPDGHRRRGQAGARFQNGKITHFTLGPTADGAID